MRVLVGAAAPPLGYRAYSLDGPHPSGVRAERQVATGTDAGGLHIERELLENRFFRLRLDERAQIVSLYDKRTGREVIAPGERGNQLIAFEDRPGGGTTFWFELPATTR